MAKYFDVTVKDLKGTARQQKIAQARQVAIFLTREILNMSYEAIGEFFDKKHTTVMYSYDIVKEKIQKDEMFKDTINDIRASIGS